MRIEADKWAKRLFREAVTLRPGEASVRQGWQEAIAGQTRPLSEVWGAMAGATTNRPAGWTKSETSLGRTRSSGHRWQGG